MSRRRPSDRVLAVVAPVVLVVVALFQVTLSRTADLTSWKGGGFGMFATIERIGERFVVIELDTDHGDLPVVVPTVSWPDGQQRLLRRASAMPDPTTLDRIGRGVLDLDWEPRRTGGETHAVVVSGPGARDRALEVRAVTVEVWSPTYDPGSQLLDSRQLASRRVASP